MTTINVAKVKYNIFALQDLNNRRKKITSPCKYKIRIYKEFHSYFYMPNNFLKTITNIEDVIKYNIPIDRLVYCNIPVDDILSVYSKNNNICRRTITDIILNKKLNLNQIEYIVSNYYEYSLLTFLVINQDVSEEFIEKHIDKLDKNDLHCYQFLSKEFKEKHKIINTHNEYKDYGIII